mmetsp:Transcript_37267/g.68180  ORF Transcript_37267/g.68180 Transcript_37267/m.68180 type:complete len:611 (-) Transcript_37267:246-2078(-)
MGGGSSFLAILRIVGFFSAVWMSGKLARVIGVSTIVFEIVTGLALSPQLLGLMPPPYAECQHHNDYDCNRGAVKASMLQGHSHNLYHLLVHHDLCEDELMDWERYGVSTGGHRRLASSEGDEVCTPAICEDDANSSNVCLSLASLTDCAVDECEKEIDHLCIEEPNVFTMVGHAGVSLMIFESGMHFDFKQAAQVGPSACAVAVLGTCLPVVSGLLLTYAFGYKAYPDGLAVGVTLAPTSVGIALKLLLEAKQLHERFGQAIITAAFVDDILSLIIFNVLFAITSGDFDIVDVAVKPVIGVIFMIIGAVLGVKFWPGFVKWMYHKLPPVQTGRKSHEHEALLFLMFCVLLAYAVVTWALGTHLWGCFVAGMSFAMVDKAHHVWVNQLKRITYWMLRIFFSCTVAFAIPFEELLSLEALWKGSVLGILACISTKVLCAFFMGETRWVIGWAMVGRAEFAYLIAEMAKSAGIMEEKVFAICIWALLYATIMAPLVFRRVLASYVKKREARAAKAKAGDGKIAEEAQGDASGWARMTSAATNEGSSEPKASSSEEEKSAEETQKGTEDVREHEADVPKENGESIAPPAAAAAPAPAPPQDQAPAAGRDVEASA